MADTATGYNFYEHRGESLQHPTNTVFTVIHMIKGCMGTGILAFPEAFKRAGLMSGAVHFAINAIFASYCMHMLIETKNVLCNKKKVAVLSYAEAIKSACDLGPVCFKKIASATSVVTNILLILHQTVVCCIYWIFAAETLKYFIDLYEYDAQYLHSCSLILFIPFVLMICLKNLNFLIPLSVIGDIVSIIAIALMFYYLGSSIKDSDFKEREKFGGNWSSLPLFYGLLLFGLQSAPLVLFLENNMKTPNHVINPFGILNLVFGSLSVIYLLLGILGFYRYGQDVNLNIIINFSTEDRIPQVIIFLYFIAITASYPLNAHVPIMTIYEEYMLPKMSKNTTDLLKLSVEMVLRLTFVLCTGVWAVAVPIQDSLLYLCGHITISILGVIFPALMEVCVYWEGGSPGPLSLLFWKHIIIVVIGFGGMASNAYVSIISITDM